MIGKQKVLNRVFLLPVEEIFPNPNQPRRVFDPEQLKELAASIAQYGLLQPITVQQLGNHQYQLVAGERRLLACKQLKLPEIPAIITTLCQEDSAALALIENIQRSNLNCFEEAAAIENLMNLLGLSQQSIALRLGKTQSTIANKLRLLKLPEDLQRRILAAGLSERHARALLPLLDKAPLEPVLEQVIAKGLTVSQTEKLVAQTLQVKIPEPQREIFVVKDLRVFMDTVRDATEIMKLAGIQASTKVRDSEEELVYTIRIKKKNVV